MSDKLTNTAIILVTALVVVSVGATMIWGWFWLVATITLIGVGISLIAFGLLKGYEHYVNITAKRGHYIQRWQGTPPSDRGVLESPRVRVSRDAPQLDSQAVGGWSNSEIERNVSSGAIGEGQPMIVGYDVQSGDTVYAKQIDTQGVGGVPGSGKTNTTLHTVLSQIVFTGGKERLLVIDPHMGGDTGEELVTLLDPLYNFFLTLEEVRANIRPDNRAYLAQVDNMIRAEVSNPNSGGKALLEWAKVLRFELAERKTGKRGLQWLIVADEFTSIMRDKEVAPVLADILETLAGEARKFGIALLLIGQNWKADRSGGTSLRDTLPGYICHRMSENWAKLVVPSDVARKVSKLDKGEAISYSNGDAIHVKIPLVTPDDVAWVADNYYSFYSQPTVVIEEVLEIEQTSSRRTKV